nr:reverse transcriptase domain-containing protein [Tanacetum cinerariifolium]
MGRPDPHTIMGFLTSIGSRPTVTDVRSRGLDFKKGPRERTREDSHHSSARARTTKPERLKVQDRLRYSDRHVLDRLGHRRQSAFDRLSETYSPSTTKSRPRGTDSRDHPRGKSRPHRLDTSNEDCPKDRERFCSVKESYDVSFSHSYRDENRSRHIKRRMDSESPLSSVSKSDSSNGRYWRSRSKRHKSTDEDDLTRPWMCEEEDPFRPRIRNFKSSRRTRMPNNVKTYDGTGDPEDHDQSKRQTSDKRSDFQGHSREGRGSNQFTPLTRMPKEILTAEAEIEELVRAGKLSHLIKEIKHGRDQSKTGKKEKPAKYKPTAIYMIQSWQRMTRQKVTQSFERAKEITFPPLTASSGKKGPLVIKAEMGGHTIHQMYVDGGSSMELLYEHCFNRLQLEIKSQMVSATTSLTGFSDETIWPLGQLRLLERTHPNNFKVALHLDFPDQEVAIRGTLSKEGRTELCSILKKNLNIFAWQSSDMIRVPRLVAKHRLNIQDGYSPVWQKKRG